MILLSDCENHMIVASFVSTQYQRVTEGQTDGRTDTLVANTAVALQAMGTRCKNDNIICFNQDTPISQHLNVMQNWLQANGFIEKSKWPPSSPDLDPLDCHISEAWWKSTINSSLSLRQLIS